MSNYVAKRIRLRGGERHSVLHVPNGIPVHEVTVYLDKYRRKGRAANTIHYVCNSLALLYRELDSAKIKLLDRLIEGRFLTAPELDRLASAVQYRIEDLDEPHAGANTSNVIHISRIGLRKKGGGNPSKPVDAHTQASRLRYIADYLGFLASYVAATLPESARRELDAASSRALTSFREHIPPVSSRAKLGARIGLSLEEQERVLKVVHPDSPDNPWQRGFVRRRNWLIIVLLLATGMRRGELLGMQIGDLHSSKPKLRILRRADAPEDARVNQPNAKTNDRELELTPSIMKALWSYVNKERRSIGPAREIPQVIVSDEGDSLSQASIDKLFAQLREACPGLPISLTSHVMRHTWNERFSEQAEAMGLSESAEERARNTQQGWSDNSKMATTYTRRHTAKKGQEISLKLQEQLDDQLNKHD
jgi:integrase